MNLSAPAARPKVLCLLGPTGTGKTEAALALAGAFGGEVVNFDSRQVYRDLPVTTAQPTPQEQAACPHLLYGFLPCNESVSAGGYAEMAAPLIESLAARGRTPILVGGTGLYLRALLEGLAPIPDVPAPVREAVQRQWDEEGGLALHARLSQVDPSYAARVHHNDRQRVTRALEVLEATGRTFSQWHASTVKPLDASCLKLGLGLPKARLDERLARRIDAMLEAGALEEVRSAVESCGSREAPGLSGIGCAELSAHLYGNLSLEAAKGLWLANTKAYAKRQMTWFKKEPDVRWFEPGQHARMIDYAAAWLGREALP